MTGESTENQEVQSTSTEVEEEENTQANDTAEQVKELKAALAKQQSLIEKLREHEQKSLDAEKSAKREKQTEIERVTELYEQKLNSMALDGALESALAGAGVRNVDVAKKVIDTSGINVKDGSVDKKAIIEAVNALKESESYLFNSETESKTTIKPTTKPGRPGEGEQENLVEKEIRNAKSVKELNAIIRKYNVHST